MIAYHSDEEDMEPDASFSLKFSVSRSSSTLTLNTIIKLDQISLRKDTMSALRKALHKVFLRNQKSLSLWSHIGVDIPTAQRYIYIHLSILKKIILKNVQINFPITPLAGP